MVFDSARQRIVVFGGTAGSRLGLGDTWQWTGTVWEEAATAGSPSRRSGHAMAYDSARGKVVLFG
ncbi:MAG: hypothetical protein HY303_19215 [Candidatus Wallbacteria bacterium]|nr:hypothetical protein [Candidatus Wallbacteria bacterium]